MTSKFLLITIALAFLYNSQADLLTTVCSISNNPSLCNQTLRSDPRSREADLKGLGAITIEKSLAASQAAIDVANSVKNDTNKGKIETCIKNINNAKDALNECKKLLNEIGVPFSSRALFSEASSAQTDVGTCDDEFGSSEPPKLKQASQIAQDLINVLMVISVL